MVYDDNVHWPLPDRADTMGQQLLTRPLFTTRQLQSGTDLSPAQAKRGILDLKTRGLLASTPFGALLPCVHHHWLTERGLHRFGATAVQRSWHGEGGIGNLLIYDMPKVEAVNDIAVLLATPEWTLSSVQWFEREPMAAVATYMHPHQRHPAYQLFCMAPLADNLRSLASRIEQIPDAISRHRLHQRERPFFPAGLSIVADDELGAAQALIVARALVLGWMGNAATITA